MSVRTPILLALLLAGAMFAVSLPGDPAGLLLLTPAVAVLLPLLFSAYPGETAVARLTSWFARLRLPDVTGAASAALTFTFTPVGHTGFSSANGSRGPPAFALQP
jgi:hypothetical protein